MISCTRLSCLSAWNIGIGPGDEVNYKVMWQHCEYHTTATNEKKLTESSLTNQENLAYVYTNMYIRIHLLRASVYGRGHHVRPGPKLHPLSNITTTPSSNSLDCYSAAVTISVLIEKQATQLLQPTHPLLTDGLTFCSLCQTVAGSRHPEGFGQSSPRHSPIHCQTLCACLLDLERCSHRLLPSWFLAYRSVFLRPLTKRKATGSIHCMLLVKCSHVHLVGVLATPPKCQTTFTRYSSILTCAPSW